MHNRTWRSNDDGAASASSADLIAGRWWRFDRYEFDGTHIRAGKRAKLEEYDPWGDYLDSQQEQSRTHVAGKRAFVPPYVTLLDTLAALPFHADSEGEASALKPAGRNALLEWCVEHGLLGVLPHRARSVVLAPSVADDGLSAAQTHYVRTTDREWVASSVHLSLIPRAKRSGLTVARPAQRQEEPPHVVIDADYSSEPSAEALGVTWARFFPGVPQDARETHPYPLPMTQEFWRAYAEPLDSFLESARLLEGALRLLKEAQREAQSPSDPEDDPAALAQRALPRLNRLVAAVSPSLKFGDGVFRQRWSSPSLLASYTMMALLDLADDRVRACAECGRLFVTDAYQTVYCSPLHASRARKRAYRSKLKSDGNSPHGKTGEPT